MSPRLQDRGINLNTILIIFSIAGASVTVGKFAGPILSGPERSEKIEARLDHVTQDVSKIQTTQAIQSESLKTLASLSQTNDRLSAEISEIRRRLDRLEGR